MDSLSENVKEEIDQQIEILFDEEKRKSSKDFRAFFTESGNKFEQNYKSLFNFTLGAITIPSWSSKLLMRLHDSIMKEEWGKVIETILDFFIEHVPEDKGKEAFRKLKQDDKFPQVKDKINKLQDILRINEGGSGMKSWLENNLISRITAYFVFSMYTYLDTYLLCIIQQIISSCNEDQLYEIMSKVSVHGSPSKKADTIIRAISNEDINIEKILKASLGNHNLPYLNKILKDLGNIRNKIAHNKPLTKLEDLVEIFPEHYNKTKINISKLKESLLEEENISQIAKENTLNFILDEFKILSIYREVGNSCFHYISILDRVFDFWMKRNKY